MRDQLIKYGQQDITDSDIQEVVNVLRSEYLTQGPAVEAFETAVANYCEANHAIATNSATSALHIACLALGLGSGDSLWTSPNTFVASANCALYCGAKIDFVDIDPIFHNLCPDKLEEKLIKAKKTGDLPKIVIPVHYSGQPCDMERIYKLSLEYGFKIIEDASHAIGAKYLEDPVGNCRFSSATVFSFHPVKIITSGEGGMITTNDPNLASTLTALRQHGIIRPTNSEKKPCFYEQVMLGYNYRMTDIHAALGRSQLLRVDNYVKTRNKLAKGYQELLSDLPLALPRFNAKSLSSLHLYPVELQESAHIQRDKLIKELHAQRILVNVHYIPVHTHPFYAALGFKLGDFPNSERFYQRMITLPLHPHLTLIDQAEIADCVRTFI